MERDKEAEYREAYGGPTDQDARSEVVYIHPPTDEEVREKIRTKSALAAAAWGASSNEKVQQLITDLEARRNDAY
jgi:hypothetical protein